MRWLLFGVAFLVGLVAALALGARFSDGPIGPFPGGALSGERVANPIVDWPATLADVGGIELQVNPAHPRSITTSYLVHDRTLYVPSILAARKRWPQEVVADGRVVVRVHGKLYDRHAVRVTDPDELRLLAPGFSGGSDDVMRLSTWYFRLDPPTLP